MMESDALWKSRHDVLYRVELSALYHQKRERFFEACDKMAKAVAVIGGSWALAKIGGDAVMPYVAATITITSTLSLVFGLADRSRRHAELAKSFRQLEAKIIGKTDFTEADVSDWATQERLLETGEPPSLGNLVRICQNELAVAQGHPSMIKKVGFFRALFAHLADLPMRQEISPQ
jgi:hypothetical protein